MHNKPLVDMFNELQVNASRLLAQGSLIHCSSLARAATRLGIPSMERNAGASYRTGPVIPTEVGGSGTYHGLGSSGRHFIEAAEGSGSETGAAAESAIGTARMGIGAGAAIGAAGTQTGAATIPESAVGAARPELMAAMRGRMGSAVDPKAPLARDDSLASPFAELFPVTSAVAAYTSYAAAALFPQAATSALEASADAEAKGIGTFPTIPAVDLSTAGVNNVNGRDGPTSTSSSEAFGAAPSASALPSGRVLMGKVSELETQEGVSLDLDISR